LAAFHCACAETAISVLPVKYLISLGLYKGPESLTHHHSILRPQFPKMGAIAKYRNDVGLCLFLCVCVAVCPQDTSEMFTNFLCMHMALGGSVLFRRRCDTLCNI